MVDETYFNESHWMEELVEQRETLLQQQQKQEDKSVKKQFVVDSSLRNSVQSNEEGNQLLRELIQKIDQMNQGDTRSVKSANKVEDDSYFNLREQEQRQKHSSHHMKRQLNNNQLIGGEFSTPVKNKEYQFKSSVLSTLVSQNKR